MYMRLEKTIVVLVVFVLLSLGFFHSNSRLGREVIPAYDTIVDTVLIADLNNRKEAILKVRTMVGPKELESTVLAEGRVLKMSKFTKDGIWIFTELQDTLIKPFALQGLNIVVKTGEKVDLLKLKK